MSWKDILKDDIRRIRDKDRRRNPKEKDEVDIEPKSKEIPKEPKKPFNPFGPDAGKRAKARKKLTEERRKREKHDSVMDTKPSKTGQMKLDLLERARKLKERREKGN